MHPVKIGIALMVLSLGLSSCALMSKTAEPKMPVSYLVFFRFDSAELTAPAREVVDQAAARAKTIKPTTIAIAGFPDRAGSLAANQRLSQRRIETVEKALQADGVDPKLFLRIPLGESEVEVDGIGDRRIEIRLQGGSN